MLTIEIMSRGQHVIEISSLQVCFMLLSERECFT